MSHTPSRAIEDYLKTIYKLQDDQVRPVTTKILADYLGLAAPSVTGMVKKLADLKLVKYEPYQGVLLTDDGREIALRVIRYHRLVELYLFEKLGVPWDEVHVQAENWEHSLSKILAERMDTVLGHPKTDPHGSPIPSPDGLIARPNQTRLSVVKPGQSAVINEVSDHDPELLRYLEKLALYPSETIQVSRVLPREGSLVIVTKEAEYTIDAKVADHIFVTGTHQPKRSGRQDEYENCHQ